MDVQNVLAHWNFHQLLLLLEVLKTQSTLSLVHHVCVVDTLRDIFGRITALVYTAIADTLHNLEVDSNDSLRFVINLLVVTKFAISAANLTITHQLLIAFLVLRPEEADDFDKHDNEEEKDGPGNQDHNHSMRDIIIFQIECCI